MTDHPWSKLEIPAEVHPGDCPMGVHLTRGKQCPRCQAKSDEACRPYPYALEAALAAARAEVAERDRRVAALEEALAPISALARVLEPGLPDEGRAVSHHDDATGPTAWRHITYGDLRRAARASEPRR